MNIKKIQNLIKQKGETPVEYTIEQLGKLAEFAQHPNIKAYLISCLTKNGCDASGIYLAPLEHLFRKNEPGVSPGGYINIISTRNRFRLFYQLLLQKSPVLSPQNKLFYFRRKIIFAPNRIAFEILLIRLSTQNCANFPF